MFLDDFVQKGLRSPRNQLLRYINMLEIATKMVFRHTDISYLNPISSRDWKKYLEFFLAYKKSLTLVATYSQSSLQSHIQISESALELKKARWCKTVPTRR
jgi:hypothetical protein